MGTALNHARDPWRRQSSRRCTRNHVPSLRKTPGHAGSGRRTRLARLPRDRGEVGSDRAQPEVTAACYILRTAAIEREATPKASRLAYLAQHPACRVQLRGGYQGGSSATSAQRTAVKQRPHQQKRTHQTATSEPVVPHHGRQGGVDGHDEVRPSSTVCWAALARSAQYKHGCRPE